MAVADKTSFLIGVQVGRRLRIWDAAREREQEQTRTAEVLELPDEQEETPDGR